MATRPYGMGPYGIGPYGPLTHDIGGMAQISCGASGTMLRTWQQPTQMCATGTWTPTSLPSGPVNDQLELA